MMLRYIPGAILIVLLVCAAPTISQSSTGGAGPGSAVASPPDILLDANVSVPLIQLIVQNISAHVAVDAKVANLVQLSVGVDVSIQTVK
jgi:hypothetical protein